MTEKYAPAEPSSGSAYEPTEHIPSISAPRTMAQLSQEVQETSARIKALEQTVSNLVFAMTIHT